jgi:hypothetical protein
MIKQKLKICQGCNTPQKIFSHGLCCSCWGKQYRKPIKPTALKVKPKKIVTQGGIKLSEKEAFRQSYLNRGGVWFLTGEKVLLEDLTATNFAHVLPKGRYPRFRYFPKNIVLLKPMQHHIFDKGTCDQREKRQKLHPNENWKALYELQADLMAEYILWIRDHPGEFRI